MMISVPPDDMETEEDWQMKQIIAFGDSNTWGLNPVLKTRYPENVRWTGILRGRLQHFGLLLKEEGLCGRTTVFEDPHRAGLKGAEDVSRVLSGNPEATAAIVMLGTNDCKKAFHASAEEIGKGLERCLDAFETGIAPERILVISPIVLGENVWRPEKDPDFDRRSVSVSAGLKAVYEAIARRRKHLFLAASDYAGPSGYDDEHLSAEGHGALAEAVYRMLAGSLICG